VAHQPYLPTIVPNEQSTQSRPFFIRRTKPTSTDDRQEETRTRRRQLIACVLQSLPAAGSTSILSLPLPLYFSSTRTISSPANVFWNNCDCTHPSDTNWQPRFATLPASGSLVHPPINLTRSRKGHSRAKEGEREKENFPTRHLTADFQSWRRYPACALIIA
jgi:hypothetical protein